MSYTRTYKLEPNKNKSPWKYIFHVYFHNKGLHFIHISEIWRNEEVTAKLPIIFQNDETPSVAYNLASTVRGKLLKCKDGC